jgi:uncharacterized membrane protein
MEYLLLLFLIVILIVILNQKSNVSSQIESLEERLDVILAELKKARSQAELREEKVEKKTTILGDIALEHKRPFIKPDIQKEEIPKEPEVKKPETQRPLIAIPEVKAVAPAERKRIVPPTPPEPPKPGFFERNPDLEKFIGENLANKIGIGVLVLGIGFFVKYAIDQDWINEIGRVAIGILCGGILLGIAHRLRKTFAPFSSVLVGGGIAVLYLTITIAFREYQLFSQTAAFMIMVVITGFAVLFSIFYNRIELAIISIVGGFIAPFLVSTGEGNYIVLFTYILILDSGMLVLAYYKKWNLVNIVSFVFTLILFGSWLGSKFNGEDTSMITGAIIFATLFYLVFFAMNIVNNIKERTTFKAIEISLLLSNTFFYYGAGMTILNNDAGEPFKGLFTALLGVFNFIFAFLLYRNKKVDKNLVFLLIGLVLTFISLAAPVQLEGNYITLFWSAETVLLLWLSQKSGIRLMRLASVLIMALMGISLLMDWEQIYFDQQNSSLTIILNKGHITSMFALASMIATYLLLRRETSEKQEYVTIYKNVLMTLGIILLYTSQFLELRHQLYQYDFDYAAQNIVIGSYNMLFILGLLLVERRIVKEEILQLSFAFWGPIAMVAHMLFYHHQSVIARGEFLSSDGSSTGFIFHYVLVGILLVISLISLRKFQNMKEFNEQTQNAYSWFYVFFFVFLASAELDHLVVLIARPGSESLTHVLTQNHKIGYPILWGLASFLLIFIGLKWKKKHLRIISLTLFLITLLKLFILDIRGISEGGKIAAFISLGVLLLTVSFMYQRLKKILLADEMVSDKHENEKTL